ncbi:hypothetical protein [Amaricoccus sp.]|uniref:hypothetical protein n=1 Tax=Amaricoccus sp. TaxID=1872485 RepID=UPI001B76E344|nr:hypothetical protein [Amaricoccus sp.]MBP7000580.1 hypothetical protein [Amaricoccus sp.]
MKPSAPATARAPGAARLRLALGVVALALAAACSSGPDDGAHCDDGGSGGRVVHGVCL